MSRKRKRRLVPKDKKTGIPKKYLSGLKGAKRSRRAKLIKSMSAAYRSGGFISPSAFKMRVKIYWHQDLEDHYQQEHKLH